MSEVGLREKIQEAMKEAMRAQVKDPKAKERLGVIRLIQAAIKQWEVDERITLEDAQILQLLDKMVRQRKESIKQFEAGKRQDLIDKEQFEINLIQEFLPTPLTKEVINSEIKAAITEVGASSIRDMGKVMAILKPKIQGRADIGEVGNWVKEHLS